MSYSHSYINRKDQLMAQILRNQPSIVWFFWLLITIVLVGLPGCLLATPGWLLGYFWYPATIFTGRYGRRAIKLMLMLNPWLKIRVVGSFPQELGRKASPEMIIANHRSVIDVFMLITMVPNVRIIAKKSLWKIPFLGSIMTMMRHIPFDRGNVESLLKVNEQLVKALKRGDPVAVFPEGRRCEKNFAGLQRMSLFAFKVARDLAIPIRPMVFLNTDQTWAKGSFKIQGGITNVIYVLDSLNPDRYQTTKELVKETQARMLLVLDGKYEH